MSFQRNELFEDEMSFADRKFREIFASVTFLKSPIINLSKKCSSAKEFGLA